MAVRARSSVGQALGYSGAGADEGRAEVVGGEVGVVERAGQELTDQGDGRRFRGGQLFEVVREFEQVGAHRRELSGQLGLDPGPALRGLEGSILRRDPTLAAADGRAPPPALPGAGSVFGPGRLDVEEFEDLTLGVGEVV